MTSVFQTLVGWLVLCFRTSSWFSCLFRDGKAGLVHGGEIVRMDQGGSAQHSRMVGVRLSGPNFSRSTIMLHDMARYLSSLGSLQTSF